MKDKETCISLAPLGRFAKCLLLSGMVFCGATAATPEAPAPTGSDSQIVLAPLFEYPQAPEEIEGLEAKSEWLLDHYWDNMDFKRKQPLDQVLVNHAYSVYAVPMRWSSDEAIGKSLRDLLKKLKKNTPMAVQFALAAEETLYGPRAEVWIDGAYCTFIRGVLAHKGLPSRLRNRWERQCAELEGCTTGNQAPGFTFIDTKGTTMSYKPMSTPTLIVFADISDPDMKFEITRTSTSMPLMDALRLGKVNVLLMNVGDKRPDQSHIPSRWTGGQVSAESTGYDIRQTPFAYLVDSEGKIRGKYVSVSQGLADLLDL